MLKVSIITVCYNSAETIADTISSVLSQDHPSIEYIVIDGASTDGTLDIINKHKEKISYFISEKDKGLYDAINKGIAAATGDVIAILHADDIYTDKSVIAAVAQFMEAKGTDTMYGDLQYVDRNNVDIIKRHWVSGEYKHGMFLKGWMPPHPSFFVRRSCYEKFGNFTLALRSAADYEMMLRLLHKHHCSTSYLPQVLVKMRVGGTSNVSIMNRLKANREDKKAWTMNGLQPGMFTFIQKPLSKIGQFFSK
jgi:glycosyltransferase involved in cell wall biosynthesis